MGDDCPYPECGVSQIKVDAKFCWKCGKKMDDAARRGLLTPSPSRPPEVRSSDSREPPPSRFTGGERRAPPAARFTKPAATAVPEPLSNPAATIRESGGLGRKPKFALRQQGAAADDESEEPSSGPPGASAFPPARPKPIEGASPSPTPPFLGSSGPPPRPRPGGDESPTATPVAPPARGKAPPRRPMGGSTTDDEGEEPPSSGFSVASTSPSPAFPPPIRLEPTPMFPPARQDSTPTFPPARPKPSEESSPASPTSFGLPPPRLKGPPKRSGAFSDDESEEPSPTPAPVSAVPPPRKGGPPKRFGAFSDDESEEPSPAPSVASVGPPPIRKVPPKRGGSTTDDEDEEPAATPSVAAATSPKYSTTPLSPTPIPPKFPSSQTAPTPLNLTPAFPPARGKAPPKRQGGSNTDDEGEEPSSGPSVASAFPPPARTTTPLFPGRPKPEAEDPPATRLPVSAFPPARQKGPAKQADENEEPPSIAVPPIKPKIGGPPPRSQDTNDSPVSPPAINPLSLGKPPPRRNEPPPRLSPRPVQPTQDEEETTEQPRFTPQLPRTPQMGPKSPVMMATKPPVVEDSTEGMSGGLKHIKITDNSGKAAAGNTHKGILKKEGRLGWDTHFVQIVGRQFQYFDSEADATANKKCKYIDLDLVANLDSQADSLSFTLEVPSSNKYESTTTWMAVDVVDRMKWVGTLVALRVPMKEVSTTVYMAPKATAEVSHDSTARILELFGDNVKKKSRKMNHFWHQRWLRVDDKAKRFAYYPTEEDAKYDLNGGYIGFTDIVQVIVPEKKNDNKQRFDFALKNGKKTGWQASTSATAQGWFVIFSKRGIPVVGA